MRLKALELLCDIELRFIGVSLLGIIEPVARHLSDTHWEIRRSAVQAFIRVIVAFIDHQAVGLSAGASVGRPTSIGGMPFGGGASLSSESTCERSYAGCSNERASRMVQLSVTKSALQPTIQGSSLALTSFSLGDCMLRLNSITAYENVQIPQRAKDLLLRLLRLAVTDPAAEVRDAVLRFRNA